MGWLGRDRRVKTFAGWVGSRNFTLGFKKVIHDQLWLRATVETGEWRTMWTRYGTTYVQRKRAVHSPYRLSVKTTSLRGSIRAWSKQFLNVYDRGICGSSTFVPLSSRNSVERSTRPSVSVSQVALDLYAVSEKKQLLRLKDIRSRTQFTVQNEVNNTLWSHNSTARTPGF